MSTSKRRGATSACGVRDTLRTGGLLHLTVPHSNMPLEPHHFRHSGSELPGAEVSELLAIDVNKPFEHMSSKRRWISRFLINRFFVRNHHGMLNSLFESYIKMYVPLHG